VPEHSAARRRTPNRRLSPITQTSENAQVRTAATANPDGLDFAVTVLCPYHPKRRRQRRGPDQRPEQREEPTVKTRTSKALGATAGIAAIALSLPLAITAYADPPAEPAPVAEIPDPQGPGCDTFKKEVPAFKSLASQPIGTALASIPMLSDFNAAISGQFNPAVNVVPVLNNGPYVVFAPTNDAFAELSPETLDALKADPAALTSFDYYHAFLGLLGPDDVKGNRPTQQGEQIYVTGKGGDIKVNDSAKVLCGGIQASNARIYIIDKVLDPADASQLATTSTTSTTSATETTTSPAETTAETTVTELPDISIPETITETVTEPTT
jgi:uncharacterized surface protein with fasciclin (FAS1) repeats